MSDPALEEGLASEDPEDVYDALIDIGKQGHRDMADRVVPYLTSPTDFLREAAVRIALNPAEDDIVRDAAFVSALVAAGSIERSEFPMGDWLPGFDTMADWPLLERALRKAGIPVPPGVAARVTERAARRR